MLRISKKERSELYSLNARIRRKQKRLKTTFNIDAYFEVTKPSQFLTRKELNLYKKQAKEFMSPYTHRYVKLGTTNRGGQFFYVSYEEYQEVRRLVEKRNRQIRSRLKDLNIPLREHGIKQYETAGEFISNRRKQVRKEGLRSPYQQFFTIKIQKETIHTRATWERFKYGVEQFHTMKNYGRMNTQFQENYIKALYNVFGSNAEPIAEFIESLTEREFIQLYYSDVSMDIDYIYSPEMANIQLQNIGNAILRYVAETDIYMNKKYQTNEFIASINEIKNVVNYDSAKIMSEYTPQTRTFIYNGNVYSGNFRAKEQALIDQNIITPSILQKSKYLYKADWLKNVKNVEIAKMK